MYGKTPRRYEQQTPPPPPWWNLGLEWSEWAVTEVRAKLVAAGESVSVGKVSQDALSLLKISTWDSLGFRMEQIPSLQLLIATETQVNAIINCIIGLQRITLLYDIEAAICESQGVQRFEDLQLGPLLHHPLIVHNFSLGPDITEIFGVSTEEIISYIGMLAWERKRIKIDELLDFIEKLRSVRGLENFCVQMHNLGKHISHILHANKGNSEKTLTHIVHNLPLIREVNPEDTSCIISAPSLPKYQVDRYTRMFLRIWKQTCKDKDISEVFEEMVDSYQDGKRNRNKLARTMFAAYPWAGLFNVAVSSMKCGLWDGMQDAPQTSSQPGAAKANLEQHTNSTSAETELSEKHVLVGTSFVQEHQLDIFVEDIVKNISAYIVLHKEILGKVNPPPGKRGIFLSTLSKCEDWLNEKFSVKEFQSLGYGEFFTFLEKYVSLLPPVWKNCFLFNDTTDISYPEACMSQSHLSVLLSQASNNSRENEPLSKQKICELLERQYPSICFNLLENGSVEDFQNILRENKSHIRSNCVCFSATLVGSHNERVLTETRAMSKDAIEVLLRAPMLADLDSWSHWDLKFAPSLGPLVKWLLSDVNTKELMCLVTKGGKVIRIDPSATLESFLEAFLQGSSFRTALNLLSLLAVYGGEQLVPLSLLKSDTLKAFEVIFKNLMDMEVVDGEKYLNNEANKSKSEVKNPVSLASKFMLDCLYFLPREFQRFAADLLLSGLLPIVKDAPSAIWNECEHLKHRLMLHELGLSLGIVEWLCDYNTFDSPEGTELLIPSRPSCLKSDIPEFITDQESVQSPSNNPLSAERKLIKSAEEDQKNVRGKRISMVNRVEVSGNNCGNVHIQHLSDKEHHSASIIESIRREEFGIDPNLSIAESSMLKKQHARLGRALHCLSKELYYQDSHFLLELVQNADDNVYHPYVEPTLTFILQEGGIIILNNEIGFSDENIRALCDVGNSTKKKNSAGYIGNKGIGFKSVFRVTDAPEIHSNGFHIKFDIREGQIGFVLPTIVPPVDIDMFSKLVSSDADHMATAYWNTCIVLPFRSHLTEPFAEDAISIFSDLHPSLLLFLHRLQCVKFRNMLNDSLIVMTKEVVGDGIINVFLGKEKVTWLTESQIIHVDSIRQDVPTTEISIAFSLEESDHGNYRPKLDQQAVFAFLPLRKYGLKFIIQGNFVVPSSREEVDADSPWNQWLLSKFPDLFVRAERSFCHLPCYRENPGKGVSAFMSFVPLVEEVHGFFSSLPRLIIPKLRSSKCLFLEGDSKEWVPPCKVLRSWTEYARTLLPESLLQEHLGLGFLSKDIVITDSLAKELGVEEYGPKILLQIMSSLSRSDIDLKSMGLGWLATWINTLYLMSFQYSGESSQVFGSDSDVTNSLRAIPFIPLLGDKYGSIDEGTIWLHSESLGNSFDHDYHLEAFPLLYANLRLVNPSLFAVDAPLLGNLTRMLYGVGVQRFSAHEVVKMHILPALSDVKNTIGNKDLMTEYLSFLMFHLQSSCPNCHIEKEHIVSEVCNNAFILTNHGYKRPVEVPIHFSKDFENPMDINKLINGTGVVWYEVENTYLKHTATKSSSGGIANWRKFFQELGVSDFVHVAQVEKCVTDLSYDVLKNIMFDKEPISRGSIVQDWESQELVNLLSQVSSSGDRKRAKYLLEVLDTFWDGSLSDKAVGYCSDKISGEIRPFKSSLLSILHDFRWMASSMDDELHYPNDLFHDCESVHSILSAAAPYALPKVRSESLLNVIGLKIQVTLDDILSILEVWRRSKTPFKASISQMSNIYTLIWNEMAASRPKILDNLQSGAFIFVPSSLDCTHGDVVHGELVTPQEVYWYDPVSSWEQLKETQWGLDIIHHSLSKSLCNVYPSLHDFFIKECGVNGIPPLRSYLQVLLQLSTVALPARVGILVFQVFTLWADGLKSGLLSSEDVEHLKDNIHEKEVMVLPTEKDKWVSLHPSFGLICWPDDEKLSIEFKHLSGIHFLHFGQLSEDQQKMLQAKVSIVLHILGIPALSQIVTRKAICYDRADSSMKTSLVKWALPYAQRYIYHVHPNIYSQLKESGFEDLNRLQIVVVNKLMYRNVIMKFDIASTKIFECSSLLQGDILYTTQISDSHSLFVELSHFLIDGVPELNLPNFLHIIRAMAESGSTAEETEFFILNSQKLPTLPSEEPVWSLQSKEIEANSTTSSASSMIDEPNNSKYEGKSGTSSSRGSANSRNAGKFSSYPSELKTKASSSQQKGKTNDAEEVVTRPGPNAMVKSNIDRSSCKKNAYSVMLQNIVVPRCEGPHVSDEGTSAINVEHGRLPSWSYPYPYDPDLVFGLGKYSHLDSDDLETPFDGLNSGSSNLGERDQLSFSTANIAQQAWLTGRIGEFEAFKYFQRIIAGKKYAEWVNEASETGLPYDILIRHENGEEEYIEVKTTDSITKNWFKISVREWQLAVDKGEHYSIARVLLVNNMVRVTTYKNPARKCQQGQLQLAIVMPK